MNFASILIKRQTRTAIVDPEHMLCWPIENANFVSAISDPMGPWIVIKDEINLDATRVTYRVNDELRQNAIAADLIFDVATLIEKISISVTLARGDVISTGTPEGVGIGFDPPRFLKDGDVVECAIKGIGSIVNRDKKIGETEKQAST